MLLLPPKIELLPEHLIDQIKAGEVIERPGNLIKEILENAVDAGSTKLELTVKNNGLDLISLKDNGHGMRPDDLPLAFSRHATSKINRFEDLYRLQSFGFRGEALASIAAISKLQCISKTKDNSSASELRIEGGRTVFQGDRRTYSSEHGTELIIQDLFYNTPVRLKFIQSQQAEKTFIRKIIFSFIISRPEIEFHIKFDESDKDIFPVRSSILERIKDIFPNAKGGILFSQKYYEENELELFLIPGSFKGPVKSNNIYINNRYILDKQLHRVMTNGLMSAFGNDDFHYIAHFHLPPDSIDVNVHPNKTIIKIMEISKVIGLLSSTIKDLAGTKTVKEVNPISSFASTVPSLFQELSSSVDLQQDRHDYNMEGFFSPHNLPSSELSHFHWMGPYILKKNGHTWHAIYATKLLEEYTQAKIKTTSNSIPLLVSEPFTSKSVKKENLQRLINANLELEFLGSETIVLRAIPEWMNGFPLKDIVQCLLTEKSFSEIVINSDDWSQSTWEEMISFFPIDELITKKILLDLSVLLREKFR